MRRGALETDLTVSASTTDTVIHHLLEEHTMHSLFTTATARQIVDDRVREAESGRRVRLIRSRGTALR